MKKIILIFLLGISTCLSAAEKDCGFVLIDKEPWKQSWVQEDDSNWKLTLLFDEVAIFTYFKNKPLPETFLGSPKHVMLKSKFG